MQLNIIGTFKCFSFFRTGKKFAGSYVVFLYKILQDKKDKKGTGAFLAVYFIEFRRSAYTRKLLTGRLKNRH